MPSMQCHVNYCIQKDLRRHPTLRPAADYRKGGCIAGKRPMPASRSRLPKWQPPARNDTMAVNQILKPSPSPPTPRRWRKDG